MFSLNTSFAFIIKKQLILITSTPNYVHAVAYWTVFVPCIDQKWTRKISKTQKRTADPRAECRSLINFDQDIRGFYDKIVL